MGVLNVARAALAAVILTVAIGLLPGQRIPNAVAATATPAISAPADVIVSEGDGHIDLIVTLSDTGLSAVSVNYATANSSAGAGTVCNNDYIAASGTLNFAIGETSKTVRIDIIDCAAVKPFRSFTFNLTTPVNATIRRASSRVAIVDNDTVVATPALFVRDAVVDEKAGSVSIPVLLGGPRGQVSASTVTVDYATSNAGATAGSDYTAASGTLTFAPNETVKNIVVDITDDATAEPFERFTLTLSNPANATLGDAVGIVVIGLSEGSASAVPAISAQADVIVGEGDGYVDLVVSLATPGQNAVSVNYATANSSAGAGTVCNNDYIAASGTLNFAIGETSKTVRIDIIDCAAVKPFRSFTFNLTTPVNATIRRASSRVAIVDNDTVVATPALFVRDAVVDEKAGSVSIPVLLGGPRGQVSASTVTVDYATSNAGATAGSDYTAASGTLTFAPNETVKNIVVDITDDATAEPFERFTLTLSNPANATLGDAVGIVVIGLSEGSASAVPAISAQADVIVGEGDGYVDLVVSLATPGQNAVSVNYATANSSAGAGTVCNNDYIAASGTLNFAIGETSKTVRIDIIDCAAVKPFRSFTFNLTTPVNATIRRASSRVAIVDNDTVVATPALFVRDAVVDEKAGSVSIPVLLGGPRGQVSASTVTVDYATSNAGATAGSDYTAASGTLTFAPNETVKNIVVDITDDATAEPFERFTLTLSNPANATLGDAVGIVVIGLSEGSASAVPAISAQADVIVGEGDGYVDLVVSLATPGQNAVSVNYATANSSAGAGTVCNNDYIAASGTLNFAIGETSKTVRIDIIDCAPDGTKTFTFNLTSPQNATIARASALVTIVQTAVVWAVPGAPTSVTASAANASAVIAWNAPAPGNGSPFTDAYSFTATSTPGNKTCTVTGALTCTVTGLVNGTSYTFKVTATNVIGTGPASTASAVVFPSAFTDIAGSPFRSDIEWVYAAGITTGCTATTYCPDASVTRGQMASFLARALNLSGAAPDAFTDDETSVHEVNINLVAREGIASGCGGTKFCPDGLVSREQMASFLARALNLSGAAPDAFTDDETSIHEVNINLVAREAIATGCGGSNYCPTANVTRGQMAAFLHRAFGP